MSRNCLSLEFHSMFHWVSSGLNLNAKLGSRLLWDETGWSVVSAIGIFMALKTGQSYIAIIAAGLSLWAWARSRSSYRAITDIPTTKLSSASQGLVELIGIGASMPEYPVISPLTNLPCLWFDYTIEKGSGKNRRIIQHETSELPFALNENDLQVMVLTDGAQVISKHRQTWHSGDETYTEVVLLKDETLYVLGELINDTVDSNHHSLENQTNTLLQEWKDDQETLKSRFDADGNGVIDIHEWEIARRTAQHETLSGKNRPNSTSMQRIRKPQFGGLFIISNYSAQQLASRYQRWSWLHLTIFLAALLVTGWH